MATGLLLAYMIPPAGLRFACTSSLFDASICTLTPVEPIRSLGSLNGSIYQRIKQKF
jgi:hypothetical protein